MHKEILTKEQVNLLPYIVEFKSKFGLIGGTAIALQIGHRRSIDFDLFSEKEFKNTAIINKLEKMRLSIKTIFGQQGELTLAANGIKCTFFYYPYKIVFFEKLDNFIKMPDLLTLAAMKAYALAYRAKVKKYLTKVSLER